jgi:protein disulfide-isomerase A6
LSPSSFTLREFALLWKGTALRCTAARGWTGARESTWHSCRWCGHCKNLAPEWKKAAKALDGIAKVVAVDASAEQSLGQQFGVQGFPTIKIFGENKKKPTDYNGARTADAITQALLREASTMVSSRLGGKPKRPSGGGSQRAGSNEPGGGKDVVTLTASDFDGKVFNSEHPWLVEFYAPWCGHCKSLAPEWAEAASNLADEVHVAAVDATQHEGLAQRFQIRGFPTIKYIPAGARSDSEAVDYNGGRDASSITAWALDKAAASSDAGKVAELTSQSVFDSKCKGKRICVIAFLPHLIDGGKAARNERLETLSTVAAANRASPFRFLWTSAGQQSALEKGFGVFGNFPVIVAVSKQKAAFAVHTGTPDAEGLASFVSGLTSGRVRPSPISGGIPRVASVEAWDGEDLEVEEDDFDVSDIIGDEL